MDVDEEFYQTDNLDYIVPFCLNNQTFLLKLDFGVSLAYIANQDYTNVSFNKF